jgi:hypothetical protein
LEPGALVESSWLDARLTCTKVEASKTTTWRTIAADLRIALSPGRDCILVSSSLIEIVRR